MSSVPPLFLRPVRTRSSVCPTLIARVIFSCGLVITLLASNAVSAFCQSGTFDGPAELPRIYVQSKLSDTPADGQVIHVSAGQNLQDFINNSHCGDTIQVQAGATFAGNLTLPAKACDDQHWIIIRTSAPDSLLPPEGVRITPCFAGVGTLHGRPDLHCPARTRAMAELVAVPRQTSGPLLFSAGANHYRFIGLEVTRLDGTGPQIALIQTNQNVPADHIIFDRMWIHGTTQDETRRGILLSGITNAAIVDSYFSDFHCNSGSGTCTDSQAISGGSSDLPGGPYKIVNNFLEAAGECILFGGGASTTTPQDIEIRNNHFFKPATWQAGSPAFVGGIAGDPFVVKNHFELKNAERVLFEGNILENNWGGYTQQGFSIVLTPRGFTANRQSTVNLCAECRVTDVTIRYNTISHTGGGFVIATALSVGNNLGVPALEGARYSIHDVVLSDISSSRYAGSGTLLLLLNSWPTNVLNSVTVNHITGFADQHLLTLANDNSNPRMSHFFFTNSIVSISSYPVWPASSSSTNCATSGVPVQEFDACFTNYSFKSNVLIGSPVRYPPSTWPAGNHFTATAQAVGFVGYNQQNYRLLPSSPYINAGTDGKDVGADINAIDIATAGVD